MKLVHFRTSTGLLAFVAFSLPLHALPQVILNESFDSYADQAALAGVWSLDGVADVVLDVNHGNTGHSLRMAPTDGGGLTNRWYKDLGQTYYGSDAEPLVFSYDLYLDPDGASSSWSGAWHTADVRSYEYGGYKQGRLQQGVAIGVSTHPLPSDCTWFQGRLLESSYSSGPDPLGYVNLNLELAPERSSGWHRLKAVMTGTQISFSVDGQLSQIINTAPSYGVNTVTVGAGLPANGITMWADNVKLEIMPEPTTLILLTLATAAVLRRRMASQLP